VLQWVAQQRHWQPSSVATFASWGVFTEIVESAAGATFVNAGLRPNPATTAEVKKLNTLQQEARTPWANTRHDAFTFAHALDYLKRVHPRLLYIAFDETDDWAHDGRYDRVLDAYARTDDFLKELWTWIQNDPSYRGRTHLLVTTDHGRGRTPKDWRDHGSRAPGSEGVWMAFVSPRMAQRGEWRSGAPLSTSQIAATLAAWVGIDWNADHPKAGKSLVDSR
jgi:hypothetical protein